MKMFLVNRKTDLRFNQDLEKEYLSYSSKKDRNYIRIAYILFTLLYGLFSIVDYYLVPDWFNFFFVIRFCFVIPLLILTIVLTYLPQYDKFKQIAILTSYIAGGLGIAIMLIIEPMNIVYYGGLFLVFTSGYFMLNLNTEYVFIGSAFILVILIIGLFSSNDLNLTSLSAIIFFISQNIIGTIGAFSIEQFRRNEFLHVKSLNETQIMLNKMVDEKIEEISKAQISTILALARLAESRDKNTGQHIERVGDLCQKLSERLPISYYNSFEHKEDFVRSIRLASSLHDIGKVGIPDSILNKPGKLTHEEFEIMKTHVEIGTSTLSKLHDEYPNNSFVQLGIEITQCHHEKWDGSGYPKGLRGYEIPLSARIMAIVDVYDALISQRSYKLPYSHEETIQIINDGIGKHFDPSLVVYFNDLFK